MVDEAHENWRNPNDFLLKAKIHLSADQTARIAKRLKLPENQARGGPSIIWDGQTDGLFGVIDRRSTDVVALLYLGGPPDSADAGWWVDSSFRGQGVGRAAVDLLVAHMKEGGFRRIGRIVLDSDQHEATKRLARRFKLLFGQADRLMADDKTMVWARHISGKERAAVHPRRRIDFSLHNNSSAEQFIRNFGRREFLGYTIFVDLVGSSTWVKGKSPKEVATYYETFHEGVLKLAEDEHVFVDKPIGDEVMLVMPDCGGEGGPAADVTSGRLLAGLSALQKRLGNRYRMRVGISLGRLFLADARSHSFEDWSVYGEAVTLAKRLHELPLLKQPGTISCAFAVLMGEIPDAGVFENRVQFLNGGPWTPSPAQIISESGELKGVGDARVAYLMPK